MLFQFSAHSTFYCPMYPEGFHSVGQRDICQLGRKSRSEAQPNILLNLYNHKKFQVGIKDGVKSVSVGCLEET